MRDDQPNKQTTTEDRATQPMEAGGWVSQFANLEVSTLNMYNIYLVHLIRKGWKVGVDTIGSTSPRGNWVEWGGSEDLLLDKGPSAKALLEWVEGALQEGRQK